MANKRRATSDSDGEDQPQDSQASKRARTQDQSDEESEPEVSQQKREKKGKGKTTRRGDGEDDHETEQPAAEYNEEEEKMFEETHGEAIRARLDAKRKVQGGVADFGIIEKVEMIDFMCHKFLTFDFGPQINFIIGHNGSGKSAVLSAITVALGGKANSTGRGNGLKSFIREGQSVSQVTITMKNQGEEAYRPKDYGKSIVICRKFSKEGSSSWKIMSKDGKTISTKKDELSAICDHMNIQVDNPMNVLTQDAARQFLSASAPTDKYNFFLRGTQLSQLSEEYDTCLENINQTKKVLNQKQAAIPDLKRVCNEATARFKEASKARDQANKLNDLKKELAWAHVAAKREEMSKSIHEVAKATSRLPKLVEAVEKANANVVASTEQVALYEKEHEELGEMTELTARQQELKAKMKENAKELGIVKQSEREMNNQLGVMKKTIDGFDQKILEETRRLEVNTQAKRDETQRKLQDAADNVKEAIDRLKGLETELATAEEELRLITTEGGAAEEEVRRIRADIDHHQQMIAQCHAQKSNQLAPYGNNIQRVLEAIKSMRWHGAPPVGPFGLHVKVREPGRWAELMRAQLGQAMSSFAITDSRDHAQLKKLLRESKNERTRIIISERDEFDYSAGVPSDPNILTVLRALDIDNEYVLRLLINDASIERTLLAPTRGEADRILQGFSSGGVAWSADFMRVQRYPEGGLSSNRLQRIQASDPRNMLFTGKDAASQLSGWESKLRELQPTLQNATNNHRRLANEARLLHDKIKHLKDLAATAHRERRRCEQIKTSLQAEANEELPVSLSALEESKAEMVAEKDFLFQQYTELVQKKTNIDDAQKPLMAQMNEIKKQLEEFGERQTAIQTKVEEAVIARTAAQGAVKYYSGKLDDAKKALADLEAVSTTITAEFEDWTAKALVFCPEIENPRKPEVIERNVTATQKALQEREKRHGASVEDMTIEVNRARANLESAEKELKDMIQLNKALMSSLMIRLARWQEFRRHIALRCKLVFQYHLSNRGYYGKVLFDHNAGTLQLKVQTDEQAQTQGGARDKDPRSLSGGEKSFSTICLLLSLWESIGCPLRCLDEFDVFMDAVNRRISMRMMIDTANASDKKQYILITPLAVNMEIGLSVRVHRMNDPERGQATLAFN